MKIKSFDRKNVRLIISDIETALEAVASKYGISLKYKSARFSASNVSFKLEGDTIDANGTVETKEHKYWNRFATGYGLKNEWLGRVFNYKNDSFVIIGLSPRKSKYPVIVSCVRNKKTFKFPVITVIAQMSVGPETVWVE